MQFRDLSKQYEILKKDIDKAMLDVAASSKYINGPWVASLEDQFADYVGVKHCITCANGTDALSLAAMAIGIKENDAVFVPDFTFFSSGEIVSLTGATPVFVDVRKGTYNIDIVSLEKQIMEVKKDGRLNPKAIIAVDLFGLPADFTEIKEIADKYNLIIIEDGAQGFGGNIDGKRACSFGDIATTSFFPAKPLGCYGDGGAIFTNNEETAELLQSLRIHGKGQNKYDNVRIGMNSRLDTMQAAILEVKLKAFIEHELNDVNEIALLYNKKLSALLGDKYGLSAIPFIPDSHYSSWAQYTVQFENKELRDAVQQGLKNKGIPSMVYYQKPMHRQIAFEKERNLYKNLYAEDIFNNTIELCNTVLSLPMHPYMTEDDVKTVCKAIEEVLR